MTQATMGCQTCRLMRREVPTVTGCGPAYSCANNTSRRHSRAGGSDMIKLTINGQTQDVDVAGDTPLLWVLRDTLGLTGTKYGCGMALCGACTVHVDGVAVRSCVTPVADASGAQVTTIEGLEKD